MRRQTTTDTRPAEGHLVADRWDRDGLTRRWVLPVDGVTRGGIRTTATLRLVERPDGTLVAALIVAVAS